MALDGIVLSHMIYELKNTLISGRIDKVYQPEKDELLLTIRNNRENSKLLLSANSSYPRLHLSEKSKVSPTTPPMFCMLLRKHLTSGKILDITQPDFERIAVFHIEATNELGDREYKKLIIEIMGRHSNIILTREDDTIIDSIKHISPEKSSVRVVLPGKNYELPPSQDKENPLLTSYKTFKARLTGTDLPVSKSLYTHFSGLSPLIGRELCVLSHLEEHLSTHQLSPLQLDHLYKQFNTLMTAISQSDFKPLLFVDEKELAQDFYSLPLQVMAAYTPVETTSLSSALEAYFDDKSSRFVISQKTADIKKLIITFIDRSIRKKAIQEKALEDSHKCERDKLYGELLTAYSYSIPKGSKDFTTTNYYEEPYTDITIPLDPLLSAIDNAQRYFKRYNKAKRTLVAAKEQLAIIEEDITYLQSVLVSLDFLETPEDIAQLRQELISMGYLKKRRGKVEKQKKNLLPYMTFQSSLGHTIYVGKNNYQNDELTMKFAHASDLWLHIKDGPGSHVIVRLNGQEIDDVTLVEASMLAAYYSHAKMGANVAIDYTLKKNVKKIPNAKPGMVIYNHFNTIFVTPDEAFTKKLALS